MLHIENTRQLPRIMLLLIVALLTVPVQAQWYSEQRDIMGTRVSVSLWHEDAGQGQAAVAAALVEVERLDQLLSPYISSSELHRVNQLAGHGPMVISAELATIIDKALYYSRLSEGAFDITFASLGKFYNYRESQKPSSQQQQELLAAIDYQHIVLDRQRRELTLASPAVQIDLGGIAKGYAVDRAMAILRDYGVEHASISAGGDSRVLGDKLGRPWIVGIKAPRQQDGMAVLLPLTNVAISTSGDYERYFIDPQTGERIHHILNPRTGQSAAGVRSVSVLGPLGFDTDPLSTTLFVLGVVKGLALIERLPWFDAVIIDQQGTTHYSAGLQAAAGG